MSTFGVVKVMFSVRTTLELNMTKRLAYRLSTTLLCALERACREQHRSQSAQAAFYISRGLEQDGYLRAPANPRQVSDE